MSEITEIAENIVEKPLKSQKNQILHLLFFLKIKILQK